MSVNSDLYKAFNITVEKELTNLSEIIFSRNDEELLSAFKSYLHAMTLLSGNISYRISCSNEDIKLYILNNPVNNKKTRKKYQRKSSEK